MYHNTIHAYDDITNSHYNLNCCSVYRAIFFLLNFGNCVTERRFPQEISCRLDSLFLNIKRCACAACVGSVEIQISNSLIIHEENTKEINTETEFGYVMKHSHKIKPTFISIFSLGIVFQLILLYTVYLVFGLARGYF